MSSRDQAVASVRRFNRFYTRRIGVLRSGLLETPYSLAEARVLFELAHAESPTATALGGALDLDAGYLSRILSKFERKRLIRKRRSGEDGRKRLLELTKKGEREFALLDARAREEVAAMISALGPRDRARLLEAMRTIEDTFRKEPPEREPCLLRAPRPGDFGWIVHRQGALYFDEYGWNEEFEALVAHIVADYVEKHDAERENAWVAEVGGEIVGCVFLVRASARVAKLRILYVEPKARGRGIGTRLVRECIRFARGAGYREITLWTNRGLDAARRIYEREEFELVEEEAHHSFGQDLVGQNWRLRL